MMTAEQRALNAWVLLPSSVKIALDMNYKRTETKPNEFGVGKRRWLRDLRVSLMAHASDRRHLCARAVLPLCAVRGNAYRGHGERASTGDEHTCSWVDSLEPALYVPEDETMMKTARERAEDFLAYLSETYGVHIGGDEILEVSFQEHARDQRQLCAENVQATLCYGTDPYDVRGHGSRAAMNTKEPGLTR